MFFPAATPMAPADLSKFKEIVFWARGDGGTHQVMVFAARLGNIPATRPFTPGAESREFVLPLAPTVAWTESKEAPLARRS